MIDIVKEGHWSPYITFLKSARMLYSSKGYSKFISKLKKINYVESLDNLDRIKWKIEFDKKVIEKGRGYKVAKYALPSLRNRLQFLTYIKKKRLVWDLKKVIKLNKDILTEKDKSFLFSLERMVRNRKDYFNSQDKK